MQASGRERQRRTAVVLPILCAVLLGILPPLSASADAVTVAAADQDGGDWLWPVDGARAVVEPFRAPAHEYGSGHRGVDIAAAVGTEVRSPAAGVVAFRGVVVDRPLLTIDHGGGLVTTFEPLESTRATGEAVAAGDVIGTVSVGGHSAPSTLHIGLRLHGVYVDPMRMFGDMPRAVLLPCCAPL